MNFSKSHKRNIRILLLARGFCDYVIPLTNALSQRLEIHLIVSEHDRWMVDFLNTSVNVLQLSVPRVRSIKNIHYAKTLSKHINTIAPDIIHVQSGIIWELLLLFLNKHIPTIATIHDITQHPFNNIFRPRMNTLTNILGNNADAIIVHGQQQFGKAKRHFSKQENIFSIDHGVIDRYGTGRANITPANLSGNILLFGTIDKWKGVEYLIQASDSIIKKLPWSHIIIAGNCRAPKYYQKLVANKNNITLIPRRQNDIEVAKLFRWADVICLPYIEASQSGVLQLAMSFGVPPVVTDVGGLPDVIIHNHSGLVIPSKNSQELARAVIKLITDNNLRETIINHIVKLRDTQFCWEKIAEKTEKTYRKVLHCKPSKHTVCQSTYNK